MQNDAQKSNSVESGNRACFKQDLILLLPLRMRVVIIALKRVDQNR